MDCVWQAFTWSSNKLILASAELQIPEMTAQNLLEKPASKTIQITHSPGQHVRIILQFVTHKHRNFGI